MFLYACEVKIQPVITALEDQIVEELPSFILSQKKEQLSVIDSETMRRLIHKFLLISDSDFEACPSIEETQAFGLLYDYALQRELYEDMLQVCRSIRANHGD